jgi:predicted N-formylglutamate amidohydrolase
MLMNLHLDRTEAAAGEGALPPCERVDGDAAAGLILLCDHARNRVPAEYGSLGLSETELARHIAYDPGAAVVTGALAARLSVPAVMSTFSRLVVDPNRGEDDPTLIMKLSDRVVVPGNIHIDDRERRDRIARFHAPYHAAIASAVEEALTAGVVPALVSVHSFTPAWRGYRRPWQVGILWDRDLRLAGPLISALAKDAHLTVGDNEPYEGALANDTLFRHGTRRGLAHALIEIRQDLIADGAGVASWAGRLAEILATLNRDPDIHEIRHCGSRTGPVDPM